MSIIQGIIQGFIGNWGMKILEFYYLNSLRINGIILLYALVISIGWRNYKNVQHFLVEEVKSQLEPRMKNWSKTEIKRNIKFVQIPAAGARRLISFPVLAKTGSIVPHVATENAILNLFPLNDLVSIICESKLD